VSQHKRTHFSIPLSVLYVHISFSFI